MTKRTHDTRRKPAQAANKSHVQAASSKPSQTRRKQAADALREGEEKYRTILENIEDGYYEVDLRGNFTFFNDALCSLLGYTQDELLGMNDRQYTDPVTAQELYRAFNQVYRTGEPTRQYDLKIIRKDGLKRIIEVSVSLIRDASRQPIGFRGIVRDITVRKQAEEALHSSEIRLSNILDTASEAIISVDESQHIILFNATAEKTFGYSAQEILGQPLDLIVPERFTSIHRQYIQQFTGTSRVGQPMEERREITGRRKDGTEFPCEIGISQLAENGRPVFTAIVVDITDRQRAEVLQNAVYHIAQAADRIESLHDLYPEIHRIISEVMPAKNFYIALANEDRTRIKFPYFVDEEDPAPELEIDPARGLTAYVLRTGKSLLCSQAVHSELERQGEIKLIGSASAIWLGIPLIINDSIIGAMVVQDYTDPQAYGELEQRVMEFVSLQVAQVIARKQAEEALMERERTLAEAQKIAHLGSWEWNIATGEERWSDEQYRILGFTPQQVLASNTLFLELVHPNDRARLQSVESEVLAGKRIYNETYRVVRRDGSIRFLQANGEVHRDSAGKPTKMVGTNLDITERRQAEQALASSESSYRGLFNGVGEAIYVQDRNGRFLDVNSTAERMYGYSRETLIGKTPLFVSAPGKNDLDKVGEMVERAFAGESQRFEFWGKRANGEVFPKEVRLIRGTYFGQDVIIASADDITDRKHAEQEIAGLAKFPSENPNPVLRLSRDGIVMYANAASGALLGMWGCVVGGSAPQFWRDLAAQALASRENKTVDIECDGKVYSMFVTPVAEPSYVNLYGRDITERKQAENALQRQNEYLTALQETTLDLVSQLNLDDLLEKIVKRAARLMGTTSGYLDLVDTHSNRLKPRVAFGALTKSLKFEAKLGEGLAGRVWLTGQPLTVDDYYTWPDRLEDLSYNSLRSIVGIPLVRGEQVVGVLGLAYDATTNQTFGAEAVQILTEFSRLAAIALENARLFETERGQRQSLHSLYWSGQAINSTLDVNVILDRLTDEALRATRASHGSVLIALREAGHFERRSLRGYSAELADKARTSYLPLDNGINSRAYKSGQIVYVENVQHEPNYFSLIPETRSELAVPILHGDEVIGNLDLQSPEIDGFWNVDLSFLQALTDQVSVALDRARLFEQIQQHAIILEQRVAERTQKLTTANEELKALDRLKDQFVSMVSHEFRTPLTIILSSAEMLDLFSTKWAEDKKREYLQRIQLAVKRMTKMLDQILIIGKAQAGMLTFNPQPLDLLKFCRDTVEELQLLVGHEHTLTFIPRGECTAARFDANLLHQIMSNLLSNAVRYSTIGGSIEFELICQTDQTLLRVSDHGIGIPLEEQAHLFESFHRASNAREIQGTGLGLAIVKRSVDLHGGTIEIVSQEGVGTTVTVALPIDLAATTEEHQ